jgi:hypothetical protein
VARPRKEVSWDDIDKLCGLQCTEEEIAQWCEVSVSTLYRRSLEEHGVSFDEYFEQKRGAGKISLRRSQWQLAQKGNPTMLIWLGKQYLGQRDKSSHELSGPDGKPIETARSLSDEQLEAEIQTRMQKLLKVPSDGTPGEG